MHGEGLRQLTRQGNDDDLSDLFLIKDSNAASERINFEGKSPLSTPFISLSLSSYTNFVSLFSSIFSSLFRVVCSLSSVFSVSTHYYLCLPFDVSFALESIASLTLTFSLFNDAATFIIFCLRFRPEKANGFIFFCLVMGKFISSFSLACLLNNFSLHHFHLPEMSSFGMSLSLPASLCIIGLVVV